MKNIKYKTSYPLNPKTKKNVVILIIAIGLLTMLGVSLFDRLKNKHGIINFSNNEEIVFKNQENLTNDSEEIPSSFKATINNDNDNFTLEQNQPNLNPNMVGNLDKETQEVIIKLMQMIKNNPNDYEVLTELGQEFMQQHDLKKASTFFSKAIKANPDYIKASYLLGICQMKLNESDVAVAIFKKLLTKKKMPEATYSLGILYLKYLNKPEEAKILFEELITMTDVDPVLIASAQDELAEVLEIIAAKEIIKPEEKINTIETKEIK